MVEEGYPFLYQGYRSFIHLPQQKHGAVFVYFACDLYSEVVEKVFRCCTDELDMPKIAIQGFLFRRPMHPEVIVFVDPLPQSLVQLLQCQLLGQCGKKPHPYGFYPALNFPFTFSFVGGAVNEGNTQTGGDVFKLMGPVAGAVVHVKFSGNTSFLQCPLETGQEALEVLSEIKLSMGDKPGVIVDESE